MATSSFGAARTDHFECRREPKHEQRFRRLGTRDDQPCRVRNQAGVATNLTTDMSTADPEARFLEQLEAHKKIVYKVAGSFCANAADRQELVQEIAIALWRALPRFDGRSKESTFVYRVALNVAVSFVREQGRRTRHAVALDEAVLDVAADSAGEEERRAIAELLAGL